MDRTPPRITGLAWGSIQTEVGSFRDAKLWPGGGRTWDWHETGTHHQPGIQPADAEEVLAHGAEVLVLGCGQQGRLQVMDETIEAIEERGASAEVLLTGPAVRRFLELIEQGAMAGALIHSTC